MELLRDLSTLKFSSCFSKCRILLDSDCYIYFVNKNKVNKILAHLVLLRIYYFLPQIHLHAMTLLFLPSMKWPSEHEQCIQWYGKQFTHLCVLHRSRRYA